MSCHSGKIASSSEGFTTCPASFFFGSALGAMLLYWAQDSERGFACVYAPSIASILLYAIATIRY